MKSAALHDEGEWQIAGKVSGSSKKLKGKAHNTGTGTSKKTSKAKTDIPHDCSAHAHVPSSATPTKFDAQVAFARDAALALRGGVDPNDTKDKVDKLSKQIRDIAALLQDTILWKDFMGALTERHGNRAFGHLVVLGVGAFSTQPCAMLQLALAFSLLQACVAVDTGIETVGSGVALDDTSGAFSVDQWRACTFDPVYSAMETRVCEALGFCTNIPDKKGKYEIPAAGLPTLCFMPHCPYGLYGNLMWANWGHLGQLVLIGNSMSSYMLRSLPAPAPAPPPSPVILLDQAIVTPVDCIALIASAVNEVPLYRSAYSKGSTPRGPAGQALVHMEMAFNDTSVIWFEETAVRSLPQRPDAEAVDAWNRARCPEMR